MQKTSERRMMILEYISVRRFVKMQEIAYDFDISLRTAKADVQILSCSHPIITKQGGGGGVKAADGWYLSRRYLSDDQETLLRSLLPKLQPEDRKTMQTILDTFAKPKARE